MEEPCFKDAHWTELRRRAESKVREVTDAHKQIDLDDLESLLHELHINQAELEMQKDELLSSRRVLEVAEQKYAELFRRYVSLFDFAPNGYLVLDLDGMIREGNLTAAVCLDTPKAKLIGRRIIDFIHRDDQDVFYLNRQACLDKIQASIFEIEMVRKDNTTFTAQVQMQCYREKESDPSEIRLGFLDISDQISLSSSLSLLQNCLETAGRAGTRQELLTEFVEHIKAFTGAFAVGILLRELNRESVTAYCLGFGENFFRRRHLFDIYSGPCICAELIKGAMSLHPPCGTDAGAFFINAASRSPARQILAELGGFCPECCLNGYESAALIPILGKGAVLGLIYVADKGENKVPLRIVNVLEKAAMRLSMALQRIDALDKLARSVAGLEDLSLRLLNVQEEEQRRIAVELHDQTGQELCLFKLRLKDILDRVAPHDPDLRAGGEELMVLTSTIIDKIRRIIHGLNPLPLDRAGLGPAVGQLIDEFADIAPMSIRANLKHLDLIKSRQVQIGVYRILQEALTNITKHAQASQVAISTTRRGNTLFIKIEDNGRGFKRCSNGTRSGQDNNSLGLSSMALRARLIGAELAFSGRPSKGTRIMLRLPLIP